MMQDYLKIENISCGYGNEFNLKEISFSVPKGKIVGIVGPNGSGKSTLFKGICGDLKLNSGSIELQHEDINQMTLKQKARTMAIVSQFVEQSEINVEDYVLLGRMPYRNTFQFFETSGDIAIAKKYMQLANVYQLRQKSMEELSGGEQQLVSIARALTQEPKLLLLDEPTAHLDIMHQIQVLNLIQKLSQELGLTVLLIIHDLNLASEFCDYLVMMNNGKIHTKGTPEEVLNYQNVEEVYKTLVFTQPNPLSKKPAIFLVSNNVLEQNFNFKKEHN